jgi:hypothetical protein
MDNQETRALLDTRHRTKTNKRRKKPQKTKKDVQRGPPPKKKTHKKTRVNMKMFFEKKVTD